MRILSSYQVDIETGVSPSFWKAVRYLISREAVFDLEPLRKYELPSGSQILIMGYN